jgi:tetratricopeptide (TPR) repeat protein
VIPAVTTIRPLESARFLCALLFLAGVLVLAGCATPYRQGQAALRSGQPDEARRHFDEALAARPERLDALAGLAVAEYRLGAFDRAVSLFEQVVARMPGSAEARLYLSLARLQRGELDRAAAIMAEARQLGLPPRTAAQIARALPLLDSQPSEAVRAFIASSLESDLEWAAEVHDARTAPRARFEPTWVIYSDWHALFPHLHGVP